MATPPFKYQPMFEKGKDTTEYYLLTKDYVSVSEFEGNPILKIEKEGLTAMANAAFRDVSFMLRRSHNEQVAKILSDPEASENDKYVALTFLRNAEVASKGVLPFCQDTGTAIIHGEKGQQVWTGYSDEEALSLGVYKTYTEENLRYSQNAPLNMYDEVNTKCNLPAQIDIEATEGMEYEFLCVTKGGGSANKTYLYQETKAILNPGTLVPFLVEKMKTSDGFPLLRPMTQAEGGIGNTLVGYPMEFTDAADKKGTPDVPVLYFGDYSSFHIQDVIGAMQIQKLVEKFSGTNRIGFQIYNLLDGQLIYSPFEPTVYKFEIVTP